MEKTPAELYNEGFRYYNKKNYTKAVELWTAAAEQGHSGAQNNLGARYATGQGVERNIEKAIMWYQEAAKQGNASAKSNLAYYYETGEGVPQDYQMAFELYQEAAEQGIESAKAKMDACYKKYMETNPVNIKCKYCGRKVGSGAKMHIDKYDVLCADCYKSFLADNIVKTSALKKKIKKNSMAMLIGMSIGLAIGLTLFFAVGLNVPGYVPFRWPVLIYLTFSLPHLFIYTIVLQLFTRHGSGKKSKWTFSITDPFSFLITILTIVVAVVGAPIETIYRLILNPVNRSRLNGLVKINNEMIARIDNSDAQVEEGKAPNYSGITECVQKNLALEKIEKSY